jgi:hypothetical protein
MDRYIGVLLACAWVLWSQAIDMASNQVLYQPVLAEESKSACEQQRQLKMDWLRGSFKEVGTGVLLTDAQGTPKALMSYLSASPITLTRVRQSDRPRRTEDWRTG